MDSGKPYIEEGEYRTFDGDPSDFVWHRDLEDREISLIYDTDWKIQLDNELPKTLLKGETVLVPKNLFHRLIKGTGSLVLKVKKIK